MAGALEESEKTISVLVILGVVGLLIWALIKSPDFDLKKRLVKLIGTRGTWGKGIDKDEAAVPPDWWAGLFGQDKAQGSWESLLTIGNDLFGTSDGEYTPEQTASMTALAESYTSPPSEEVQNAVDAASADVNEAVKDPDSAAFDLAKSMRLF
jgi:hypothetical protein